MTTTAELDERLDQARLSYYDAIDQGKLDVADMGVRAAGRAAGGTAPRRTAATAMTRTRRWLRSPAPDNCPHCGPWLRQYRTNRWAKRALIRLCGERGAEREASQP